MGESICNPPAPIHRRTMLARAAAGFGSLALADLLANHSAAAGNLNRRPAPHFPPSAKRVIFLFMHGAPSQLDTFDYKPSLISHDGKPLPFAKPRIQFAKTGNLLKSPWEFRQYGQSGSWVSELFPNVARHVDDMTFLHSIHGSNEAHGGALLKIHTGTDTFVRPSLGAWVSYGLGTESNDLPSFITMSPTLGHGGVRNFGAAFLPPIHQGTRIGLRGQPLGDNMISNLVNEVVSPEMQRRQLGLLQQINRGHLLTADGDRRLEARIQSFELAYRMQQVGPQLFDVDQESEETHRLYGLDNEVTEDFGRQCLLARRFAEAGVRYVQCTHGYWDQHTKLREEHSKLAKEVDKPIAGLLTDLKRRGLLDDTLLIWGAEFGRTPTAQGKNGRDHNPHAFTWWMAGGGVKAGFHYGESDEFGFYTAKNRVHVHDLHATILHLLGLDHERLTYRYGGRDFRLTDVHGSVVREILA